MRRPAPCAVALIALCWLMPAGAAESRRIQPIATPERAGAQGLGAVLRPVAAQRVRDAVETVYARYNRPDFEQVLADGFYERRRLADAIALDVPRDAAMRVLSISNVHAFGQTLHVRPGQPDVLESLLAVTVRAQLEFITDTGTFDRHQGTHELQLRIFEEYAP